MKTRRNPSMYDTIFSVSKIVLGTTLTYFPHIFATNGIILSSLVIILLGGVFSGISTHFLIKCGNLNGSSDYTEIGKRCFGSWIKRLISFSIFIIGFFSLIVYIDTSSAFIRSMLAHSNWKVGKLYSTAFNVLVNGTISSIYTQVDKLKFVNTLGLISIGLLLLITFYEAVNNSASVDVALFNYTPELFDSFGLISLCFCSHFMIIPVVNAHRNKSNHTFIIIASSILSVLIYLLAGILGYIAYPNTPTNWAENKFSNPSLSLILSGVLFLVNTFSFPLCMIAAKNTVHEKLKKEFNVGDSNIISLVEIWSITLLSCLFTILFSDIEIINASFLPIGALIMFILPCLMYMKSCKASYEHIKRYEWIFIGSNLILGGFLLGRGVYQMIRILINTISF